MFISEALAQTTQGAANGAAQATVPVALGATPLGWLPYVLIILVFYMLILRPQQQKVQAHQKMLSELKAGDRVLTAGGFFGTIRQISAEETEVTVEIATGVTVRMQKTAVTEKVLDKTS